MRPSAAPSHAARRARASSMAGRTCCFSRAGAASSLSIRHLPTVARMPLVASVSSTTSVPCTVSIVSAQVVPVRRSSCTASRVLTRSDASSCAASIGHTRCRSQASNARSSAAPRKSVWHRWTCVCTNPGSTRQPETSRVGRSSGTAPPTCVTMPSRTTTGPSTTSRRSFMVSTVPPRRTNEDMWRLQPTGMPADLRSPQYAHGRQRTRLTMASASRSMSSMSLYTCAEMRARNWSR